MSGVKYLKPSSLIPCNTQFYLIDLITPTPPQISIVLRKQLKQTVNVPSSRNRLYELPVFIYHPDRRQLFFSVDMSF